MPDQPRKSGFISGGSLLASMNSIAAAFMQYLSRAPARMCSSAACHEAKTYRQQALQQPDKQKSQ